jgi:pyruvate dehydrogenase E2 component (dihydrolipoamide acetyltransferase)
MEEGTFVEWLKREGDRVEPGEALFGLESDKSAENIEAIDAGILRLVAESPRPGDRVKVGQVIACLLTEGECESGQIAGSVSDGKHSGAEQKAKSVSDGKRAVADASGSLAQQPANPLLARRAITPRARRVARERGIDVNNLQGTGRNGRIRERDILAAAPEFLANEATEGRQAGKLLPHTAIRRTVAARMVAGVTQAAPVTLFAKVDATSLVNLRRQLHSAWRDQTPSISDLVMKLTAIALREHPLLQAQWREDGLFVPERIDIALGVDTESGLLAPVVRNVDQLTLRQLTAGTREQVALARAGKVSVEQMRDATFTVTNLGMFGIDAFTPIINLPQCAVLGIGRIVREPAEWEGSIVPRDRMTLSLTFDHRVVDGAPAARFLQTLAGRVEQPAGWLMT